MGRFIVALLAAAALLVLPGTALAKGPSEVSISGPGLAAPLRLGGVSEFPTGDLGRADLGGPEQLGGQEQLGALMQHAGFSEGVWGPQAGVPAAGEPAGELGPRYSVTWTLPGSAGAQDTVRQDLYPHAEAGPLTYVAPGQPFFDGQRTAGGWFVGGSELSTLLHDLGLREPAPPPPGAARVPAWVGLVGAVVTAGCAAAWAAARGRRPAALPG